MGPAGAEVRHRPSLGRPDDAPCLCSDERLMIDEGQYRSLRQLCIDHGCRDGDDGLVGVDDGALVHGVHIALEAIGAQVLQEPLVEHPEGAEVLNVLILEMHVLDEVHDLLQPCENCVSAVVRDLAEEHVERSSVMSAGLMQVSVGHRHLIQVHHHGQVALVEHAHFVTPMIRIPSQHPATFSFERRCAMCGSPIHGANARFSYMIALSSGGCTDCRGRCVRTYM